MKLVFNSELMRKDIFKIDSQMKIIIGLGNPGEHYRFNRHNVGFLVLDKLIDDNLWQVEKSAKLLYRQKRLGSELVELIKPQMFMNNSGQVVGYIQQKFPQLQAKDIYVVHDDLDILLGIYKIQQSKGPREHKGILSIKEKLGEDNFWRIRIGVENRQPGRRTPGEKYVLENFSREELEVINQVIDQVRKDMQLRLTRKQNHD